MGAMGMHMGNNHTTSHRACAATVSLLAELIEMAEEASLGDLALYLQAARRELAAGPWRLPPVHVGRHHATLADAISALLATLEELRGATDAEAGLASIAVARLYIADGIRHLDRIAERVARETPQLRWPLLDTNRIDWRWVS